MNLTSPILVAIDLEPGLEPSMGEARRVAEVTGAELTLVHAVAVKTMPQFGDDTPGDRDRAEVRCREVVGELARAGARVSPDPIVRIGRPSDLILETVKTRPTSFVFLGDGGKAKLDRILLGANVERILQECPRPVWVVHPREGRKIERLLVAVDTSRAAGEALKLGVSLAGLLGARLDLLRVFPETGSPATSLAGQQEELRRYASQFDLGDVQVDYVTWEGEPGKRIVESTAALDSDVLIIGTAGRRGIYRWLRRPIGERVVRQLPCSLLCVPALT